MDQFSNHNNPNTPNEDNINPSIPTEQETLYTEANEFDEDIESTADFHIPQQQQYYYSSNSDIQPSSTNYSYHNNGYEYINNSQSAPSAEPNTHKQKRSSGFSLSTLIASVIICAIVSTIVSSSVAMLNKLTNSDDQSNTNNNNSNAGNTITTITNTTENFVEAVAQKVQPSVVGITVSYNSYNFFGNQSSSDSSGSGVIYTADGYIITNKHVIEYAINRNAEIMVYLSNNMDKPYPATVIGYDSSIDLAVIKINETNLPAIEIGNSSDLKVGQNAVAIGTPGGLEFMGSVSVGYISGLNRELTIDSMRMNLIQTDTAINPGNSGGALVDNEGKLIGITNAKLVSEDFEGMGFAIPVDKVTEICDRIITGKDSAQPYIGVNINTSYTADILEGLGFPAGAVVSSVVTDSPAYNAGIREYDIIVAVDGTTISSYDQLVSAIQSHKVGDKMKVRVYRSNKYLDLTVTVGTNS